MSMFKFEFTLDIVIMAIYIRRGNFVLNCSKILSVTKDTPGFFTNWRLHVSYAGGSYTGTFYGIPTAGGIDLRPDVSKYTIQYNTETECDTDLAIFERIIDINSRAQIDPYHE